MPTMRFNRYFILLAMLLTLMLTFWLPISHAQDPAGGVGESAAPPSCPRGDNINTVAYYDSAQNYCLIVPVGYAIETTDDGTLLITTENAEAASPTQLQLMITPAPGQTLPEMQTALQADFAATDVTITETILAGIPALLVANIPGEPEAFQALLIRETALYTFTLAPYDEQLWRAIATSLHFPPPPLDIAVPEAPTPPTECPTPTETTQLVYQPMGYYCFVYPADFTATAGTNSGGVFIVPNALPTDAPAPTLGITVNVAPDVTLDEIEDNLRDQLSATDIAFERISIGGVDALVTDDLPGSIGNRQAFLLANKLLYLLTLSPVDAAFPASSEQAEALWTTLLASFTLLPPPATPERPVIQTLFNARFGYSLIYPAGFQITEQPDGAIELTEQITTPDTPQTRFSIFALPASGRALPDFQTEIEAQNAGLELQFTTATIGGEAAIVTDKLPTLATSRQAFFIHEDTLFILVLMPFDEALWQTFTADFEFINVTQGSPIQASLDALGAAFLLPENWRLTQFSATYYINSATGSIPMMTLRRDDTLLGGADTAAFVARVEARLLPDSTLDGISIGTPALPVLRAVPAARDQICQVVYVPRETFTLLLTINRPACAEDGTITNPEVLRLLESLTLYTPIE